MKRLLPLLMLINISVCAQIQVAQFNAEWNKANEVTWIGKLSDCETISYVDIGTQASVAKQHKIAVIPTIIIFKDNEEVARFQADLSFKMIATKEEIQEIVDEIVMSDF